MALRFAALLLAAAAPAMGFVDPCTVDYTTYSPGKVVNEWTQGGKTDTRERMGVQRYMLSPAVAVWFLLTLFVIDGITRSRAARKMRTEKSVV